MLKIILNLFKKQDKYYTDEEIAEKVGSPDNDNKKCIDFINTVCKATKNKGCYYCIYIKNNCPISCVCNHPSNIKIIKTSHWYKSTAETEYIKDPFELNKNNHCPNFKYSSPETFAW